MNDVESELIKATDFTPAREYSDRQDYLAALARAVDQLDDDEFDRLSVEAAEWFNAAVRSLKAREEIADFDGDDDEEQTKQDVSEPEDDEEPETEVEVKTPFKRKSKGQPPKILDHPPIRTDIDEESFALDKWGCVIGTKNAAAADMLERGCRMQDINATIGGTYYNLINRFVKQGHKVEKAANGVLKLTHKDDL